MRDAESIRRDALVESISDTLDVPESAYEQAAQRYEAVGRWLSAANSSLGVARPVIYPQGSFALGTVTKPLPGRDAEYDIDAVVELGGRAHSWAPADLKRVVGDRLREHDTYARMLGAEGRRCWTLDYAAADDAPGFHMDLLPSVGGSGAPVVPRLGTTAIAITNRTPARTYEWRSSDPKC